MNPIPLAGPAVEPIAVDEMKAYLRLDGSTEDELVAALVVAGRITVERRARLSLIRQSWRLALPSWPEGRAVRLPFHPVLGIDEIRLTAETGPPVPVDPGRYRLDADGARLLADADLPGPAGLAPRVEIDVSAGFGDTAAAVPEPLILAVKRLAAHWFEHRGDERQPGQDALPPDILSLIAPFCRPRLA
jgi:uncharacterized phiE125 gp8 family phage protein